MEYTITKEVKKVETLKRGVELEPCMTGFVLKIDGVTVIHCNEGDGNAYVFQDFYNYFPTIEDRDQKMRKRGDK